MEISWNELKNKMSFVNIIDIRENYLYNMLKIKNSKNIPYQFLVMNPLDYLTKGETYYILCEHGHKSKMVSDILNKEGFNTYSITGGIYEYKKNNN